MKKLKIGISILSFLFSSILFGGIKFPKKVLLKTKFETKNERFEFFLNRGKVYYREFEKNGSDWQLFPMPEILLDKRISAIAADNRYIIFLDEKGWVYKTKQGTKEANKMKWTSKWGHPVGMGKGLSIHKGAVNWDVQDWDMSPGGDARITDPLTRAKYRTFSIAHIFMIFDGGNRVSVHDPFLPTDDFSYELCLPKRNRLKAKSFSSSGGFVFIMNKFGDMYTRLWNLDIAGYNQIYARYIYKDQKVESGRHTGLFEFLRKIRLPSPNWKRQPKIKGKITNVISIFKERKETVKALLRVEGSKGGKRGVFEKDINDEKWTFRTTNNSLKGKYIDNKNFNSSNLGLGIKRFPKKFHFKSKAYEMVVKDYNIHCSPDELLVTFKNGVTLPLKFHARGIYRLKPSARGLSDFKIKIRGAIEIPKDVFNNLSSQPKVIRSFLRKVLKRGRHKRYVPINGYVTKDKLFIKTGRVLGSRWTLKSY